MTAATIVPVSLFMSIDTGGSSWQLAFSDGLGRRVRQRRVNAGDLAQVALEVDEAKTRLGLEASATVWSGYEAGHEGFWLHRELSTMGVQSLVIDPASVQVSRKSKQAKTDRLDARALLSALVRWVGGDHLACKPIRIPGPEAEDDRHLHREIRVLQKEMQAHMSRLRALLGVHGHRGVKRKELKAIIDGGKGPTGVEFLPRLKARLAREYKRLLVAEKQLDELRKQQREEVKNPGSAATQMVKRLCELKGIGVVSAWILVMEFFAWRDFKNRREVGAAAGLTGTPHASDGSSWDKGVSKSGNKEVRRLMIELSWLWLRYQPGAKRTLWYRRKWGTGSKRLRRVGIVALSRALLVDIWHWVEHGVVPEGALIKAS